MKFTAFGSIIALALVGAAAAQTCTVKAACRCDGMGAGNFCGDHAAHPNCLDGHLYQCDQDGTTCDLGLNDSCKK
ncbi:hypothetical protein F5887DRAFT_1000059 [Amanita rubescens]|nr:hypothetical protein F5887DRAFT_1000059 [Amanita rubescens]